MIAVGMPVSVQCTVPFRYIKRDEQPSEEVKATTVYSHPSSTNLNLVHYAIHYYINAMGTFYAEIFKYPGVSIGFGNAFPELRMHYHQEID